MRSPTHPAPSFFAVHQGSVFLATFKATPYPNTLAGACTFVAGFEDWLLWLPHHFCQLVRRTVCENDIIFQKQISR